MTLRDQILIGKCTSLSDVKRIACQRGIPETEAIRHFKQVQKKWEDEPEANAIPIKKAEGPK